MCHVSYLGYYDKPLVEGDFKASPRSGTFDAKADFMLRPTFVKALA